MTRTIAFVLALLTIACQRAASESLEITILRDAAIHFHADSAGKFASGGIAAEEQGRIAAIAATLPEAPPAGRIRAILTVRPVPLDDRNVHDRWDRAGNIRLASTGCPDLEIVRFVTAYGGRTDHEIDVSHLAPLLRGDRRFRAFIDTWTSPAWTVDFALSFSPDSSYDAPVWVMPVYYTDAFKAEDEAAGGGTAQLEVPQGLSRVALKYISTGHCTDGRDEDEFISKANVVYLDGRVVARVYPWRDDCRGYRDRNPYCARWTDGSWSSDYSRSGWCPGVEVEPMEFDLSDHLGAGSHTFRFMVENVRPTDENGHYGYWRISAYLVGWDRPPRLWRN